MVFTGPQRKGGNKVTEPTAGPQPGSTDDALRADVTLPEAVMLLLFDPRTGTIAGEGQSLMYTLGGAMLTELAMRGHIELDERNRRVRAGHVPEDSLLRGAWDRVPQTATGVRGLAIDIGVRSRDSTLNRLLARGDIRQEPRRLLGFIPTRTLKGGDTGTRDRLLGPVRSALVDGVDPDARVATLVALLSASKSLPAMDADIPWSGEVYKRGKRFERGDWGAKATSNVILSTLVVQIVGTAFATTVATLAQPD
ncbi:GPP34 family phosphoprotein [Promicromonospora sukumoe]|uniref:GOLPH3/VPS74 family protein n=1 Tax=Promicromonospora sukumoe TaxID=88382 RepID=UPI003650FF8A